MTHTIHTPPSEKSDIYTPKYGSGRVGLMIFNAQPWGRAYERIYNMMNQDCDTIILGFGSTQNYKNGRQPFTFEQRLEMVRILHGNDFKPLPLKDIDSSADTNDWIDYVLTKIKKMNLPEPTDYYTGSPQDANWYTQRFASMTDPNSILGDITTYENPTTHKRLHIVDRTKSPFPSATEVRTLIQMRNDEWKKYVPERLISYVDWNYPPEMRYPVQVNTVPPDHDETLYPIGTQVVLKGSRTIYVLHDDLKWREKTS